MPLTPVVQPDRWHSALAVAEALVDWHRDTVPEDWRATSTDDVAAAMVLLARVLARRDQRHAARRPDRLTGFCEPDDLADLALGDVLHDVLDDELQADVVASAAELDTPVTGLTGQAADLTVGEAAVPLPTPFPRTTRPAAGQDEYHRLVDAAQADAAGWTAAVDRVRTVLQHHIDAARRGDQAVLIEHRREALRRHAHLRALRTATGTSQND